LKEISFTNHCLEKIEILRKHKINVDKETISNTVLEPERIEEGYNDRKIAQKLFDENHVIRVVYEESDNNLRIITVYPGRRKRYEKD
jgi:uncharacterized DUF497 family protein